MIIALLGGVGGARFAAGLDAIVGSGLTAVVNTGDDFVHLSLPISPDIDTVVYTLAGRENAEQGWGVRDETWNFLDQIRALGGPTWFQLGDKDLAMHVSRLAALTAGRRLTEFTRDVRRQLAIGPDILPMCDEPVHTIVHTAEGDLAFQDYFVRLRCAVEISGFSFSGIDKARPTPEVAAAFEDHRLEAILVGPSNPFVSITPIVSVPGMRELIAAANVPVVAVSPIIAGAAVKGPAAKMMTELGMEVSSLSVARQYEGLATAILIDEADAALAPAIERLGLRVGLADILMSGAEGRRRVAEAALALST